jgi:hypothetical protein
MELGVDVVNVITKSFCGVGVDVVGTEVGVDVDGRNVGVGVGADDGMDVGLFDVGVDDGMTVGLVDVGAEVGMDVGLVDVGVDDGVDVGFFDVGVNVGIDVGLFVGYTVGFLVSVHVLPFSTISTLALVAVILNTLTIMVFPPIVPVHIPPALNFPPGSKFESAPLIPSFIPLVTVT